MQNGTLDLTLSNCRLKKNNENKGGVLGVAKP